MGSTQTKSFEEMAKEEVTTPEVVADQAKVADEVVSEVIAEEKSDCCGKCGKKVS